MPSPELSGVVSLDLTRAPQVPPNHKSIEATAKAFQVVDEESFLIAKEMIEGAASNIAKVEAFFEEDKTLAHRLHKSICDKISSITAPWRAVRPNLEPRMKRFRAEQERIKREAEERVRREREEIERKAREEAARIQREAEAKAAELRRQGEMRAAREEMEAAKQGAAQVVESAQAMTEVGIVLPDAKPAGGPGESRPWVGEVENMRALCKAIGDGTIPLEYLTPVRGQGEQMRPLVLIDQAVLNHIAKRMGSENIGIPGCVGKRDLQLRFGSKGAASAATSGEDW